MALVDNIAAMWEFTGGSLVDSHASHTLTNVNGVSFPTDLVGECADLESSSTQYLTLADHADLRNGNIDWSWGCLLKFESLGGTTQQIITRWNSGASLRDFQFRWNGSNLEFLINAGSTTIGTVTSAAFGTLSTATPYFVTLGHDDAAGQIWMQINAGSVMTAAMSGNPGAINVGTTIGSINAGATPFDGRIDQIMFFKRNIQTDAATLYNGGAVLTYAQILAGGAGGGGQPFRRRFGGCAHLGNHQLPRGHRGGVWGRTKDELIVPRRLAA